MLTPSRRVHVGDTSATRCKGGLRNQNASTESLDRYVLILTPVQYRRVARLLRRLSLATDG